jgi:hypothetical protein
MTEHLDTAIASAAVASPWWLPSLADFSNVAAELLPIMGVVWIVTKIVTRIIEVKRGE